MIHQQTRRLAGALKRVRALTVLGWVSSVAVVAVGRAFFIAQLAGVDGALSAEAASRVRLFDLGATLFVTGLALAVVLRMWPRIVDGLWELTGDVHRHLERSASDSRRYEATVDRLTVALRRAESHARAASAAAISRELTVADDALTHDTLSRTGDRPAVQDTGAMPTAFARASGRPSLQHTPAIPHSAVQAAAAAHDTHRDRVHAGARFSRTIASVVVPQTKAAPSFDGASAPPVEAPAALDFGDETTARFSTTLPPLLDVQPEEPTRSRLESWDAPRVPVLDRLNTPTLTPAVESPEIWEPHLVLHDSTGELRRVDDSRSLDNSDDVEVIDLIDLVELVPLPETTDELPVAQSTPARGSDTVSGTRPGRVVSHTDTEPIITVTGVPAQVGSITPIVDLPGAILFDSMALSVFREADGDDDGSHTLNLYTVSDSSGEQEPVVAAVHVDTRQTADVEVQAASEGATTTEPSTAAAPLARLAELTGQPNAAGRVVDGVRRRTERAISELRAAIASDDIGLIQVSAERLRRTSSVLGASRMEGLALRLSAAISDRRHSEIAELGLALAAEFERVRPSLNPAR